MTEIELKAQELAGTIDAADLTPLTSLLETGLSELARVPEEAAQRITDVKLTVASALQQVSDAVRAVPLDSVANAIRSGADAVGGALEEVTDLLGAIDDALGTAVDALRSRRSTRRRRRSAPSPTRSRPCSPMPRNSSTD